MGKKLTVSKKSFMYALMILPFVFPEMFYFNGVLSKIIVAWKMLVVVFSGLLLIKQRLHIKKSRLFLFLFLLYNIALSFYNGVMPSFEIYELSMVIIFCYYLDRDMAEFLKVVIIIGEIMIYINFATVIIFPNGMYTTVSDYADGYSANWFLGYKNPMVRLILPICLFSYVYSEKFDKSRIFRSRILLAVSIVTVIMVKSSGGIMGLIVCALFVLGCNFKSVVEIINRLKVKAIYFLVILIDIVIVVLRQQTLFSFVIDNFLQRSTETLTGRTEIWDVAINLIVANPVFGYGESSVNLMHKYIYASHPHNYILYIVLQGGLISFILLTAFIFVTDKSLNVATKNNPELRCMVLGAITSFFVMGIAESLTSAIFYYPLFALCDEGRK